MGTTYDLSLDLHGYELARYELKRVRLKWQLRETVSATVTETGSTTKSTPITADSGL